MENNQKIGYALPGMYTHYQINKILFDIQKHFSEYFYDNFSIDAVFGNFQFCPWDGGRIFPQYQHTSIEKVREIQHYYNNILHIPIRFVYTNSQIKEEILEDRFSNLVTSICENELNEIVVNSPILEKYLREQYPKYKFISSTTKCILDKNKTKELLSNKNYNLICLDYNLNYDLEFLKTLTKEQKNKTEFLVNAICGAGCPNRKQHYKLNSIFSNTYGKMYNLTNCKISDSILNCDPIKNNQITYEDIMKIYAPLGFKHFKLEGRTFDNIDYIGSCIQYLVKLEHRNFIMSLILHQLGEQNNDQNY